MPPTTNRFDRARITYNYCGICGHVPPTEQDEPNRAPLKWWDPDDGWKIGSLCRGCFDDHGDDQPNADDYAFPERDEMRMGNIDTDEDPFEALVS